LNREQESEAMAVIIRQAGPGDEPAVVELVQELAVTFDYPTTIDEHYVRHFLASPVSDVLLAFDENAAVGLLSYAIVPGLFHTADSGLIESLVVIEGRRGEGIGRQLLQTAVRLLEEAGCVEISVSTGADNEAAQKLYFDVGLTEASVLLEKHIER
jgi:ribosomal protein S18 acetylase RimI-like enzyme